MGGEGVLDHSRDGLLEVLTLCNGGLQGIGHIRQHLGHGGIDDHVGHGDVLGGAQGAELKLVAREGEGGGTVAVGGVLAEGGDRGDTQIHGRRLVILVYPLLYDGVDDVLHLLAEEHGDDGGGSLKAPQTVIVAGVGHRHTEKILVLVHGADDGGEEEEKAGVLAGGLAGIHQILAPVGGK